MEPFRRTKAALADPIRYAQLHRFPAWLPSPLCDMTLNYRFRIGDIVRIVVLHDGLKSAPPEIQTIYKNAFMRPLRIDGIDGIDGCVWVELNVNDDGSQSDDSSQHTLCLPPEEVELVPSQDLESNGTAN